MSDLNNDVFYVVNIFERSVVQVQRGKKGFWPAPKIDEPTAKKLNKANGFDACDVQAAEICSLSGNWAAFDDIKATLMG